MPGPPLSVQSLVQFELSSEIGCARSLSASTSAGKSSFCRVVAIVCSIATPVVFGNRVSYVASALVIRRRLDPYTVSPDCSRGFLFSRVACL